MCKITPISDAEKPICLGSGLVTLDVIFRVNSSEPEFLAGGSCCNVLTILSYLGWSSFPVARLGCDVEGDRIVEDMSLWGVHDKFIVRDCRTHSPRIIQRIYAGKNPRHSFSLRCLHGRWLPHRKSFRLDTLKHIENNIPKAHVFYFDRATPSALELARRQKKLGALIVFEPPKLLDNKNFRACLEVADIFKHCYGLEMNDYQYTRPPLEIQTRGKDGLRYRASVLSQTEWTELPAFNVNGLIDAAGSGDWLTAGLIHALRYNSAWQHVTDESLHDALCLGQCLAALNCLYSGARGLMYNVPLKHLNTLIRESISAKNTIHTVGYDCPITNRMTDLSSKCRICLCR